MDTMLALKQLFGKKSLVICLLVVASVLLVACGARVTGTPAEVPAPSDTPVAEEPVTVPVEKLYENSWVLVAYGDPANPTVLQSNTLVTASFSGDGTLAGSSACNQYRTGFSASSDGSMTIQPEIISTMMMCPDELMAVEQAYQQVLPLVESFGFSPEGRLELGYPLEGDLMGRLVFAVGEVPLAGTAWTLLTFGEPDNLQTVPGGTVITANFGTDGTLAGSAGCNSYATTYTAQDGQISVQPVATTMMACEEGMELEQGYLEVLGSAVAYQVLGQNLTLTAEDGRVLNYTSVNLPLETTEWSLIAMNGQSIPTDIPVTLYLQPGEAGGTGTAGGTAGCNQYNGQYTLDGENLTFSEFIVTLMACEEPVMLVESAYLASLELSQSYQILGATLIINTSEGALTFVANRTPLTGALWELRALGDIENPSQPVPGGNYTAQFTRFPAAPTGVVAGTTGCNEYAASFAASLSEIKVNMPDSTENTTCVPGLLDQEQLYFLALNDANQYHILGNILTIFYDGGNQALIYEGTQLGLAQRRPLTDLQGMEWYLWTINNEPVINGSTINAEFNINPDGRSGTMNGSAGCNKYQAIFGEDLGMQTTLNSNEACVLPIGVMEQERFYLQALSRSYGYWLTDDQLIINTGSGALSYRLTSPPQSGDQTHLLQQNSWYLVSYNTTLSAPGGQGDPNIRFNLDNSLSGYTGCNVLMGRYATDINKITISELTQTQEPCPNTALAAQEKAIMDVLGSAQTYQVIDTSMQLVGSAGVLNYFFAPVNQPDDVVPPSAVISAPTQATVGEIVSFDASESTAQVPITSYSWEFGDGGKVRGKVVRHVYDSPGTYLVQMTVTDARNFRNSATMDIEILPLVEPTEEPTPEPTTPPEATPEPTQPPVVTPEPTAEPTQPPDQQPPTAALQSPGKGFPGEPVVFNALDSQPGSSPISSYRWDFGDGTTGDTGDQALATNLFNHSGIYDVTVLVTDQNGLSDSATTQIVIDARLDSEVWDLYELMEEPLVSGTTITLQFLEGEIAGFSSCNSYRGNYVAEENEDGSYNVTIEDLQITQISCPEEIMKQEALFLGLLASVQEARIEANALMLSYPEGIDPEGEDYPAGELLFYELGTPIPF